MNSEYPLALPKPEGAVFVLDESVLQEGMAASLESPRKRIVLPVHRSATEGVQRMLNFMQPCSYARPHCHPAPENIETVIAVRGAVGFVIFNGEGTVLRAHRLEAGAGSPYLVDIERGVWHTVVPLTENSVILEIKRGQYNAATDKIFAAWAPEEGADQAGAYLRTLEALFKLERAALGTVSARPVRK